MKAQRALGKNINKLRTKKDLTQRLLADLATIDRRFLQRIESGQSAPTIEVMVKVKRALKCSWDDLLDGVE